MSDITNMTNKRTEVKLNLKYGSLTGSNQLKKPRYSFL